MQRLKNERRRWKGERMMGTAYGYARVSTREQNEVRQIIALKGVKVTEENIYIDKQSGQKIKGWISWFWICRFWIPGGRRIY